MEVISLKEGEEVGAILLPEEGKMTVDDLAWCLKIYTDSLKSFIQRHRIPYTRIGRAWVIDLQSFWSHIESQNEKS